MSYLKKRKIIKELTVEEQLARCGAAINKSTAIEMTALVLVNDYDIMDFSVEVVVDDEEDY